MQLTLPEWSKILILAIGFMLTQFSISLFMPALPTLGAIFHASPEVMLRTVTWLLLGYGIGQLIWGTLSDRFGRICVLIIALLAYIVATTLIIYSRDLLFFKVAISLAGFCIAAMPSIGNALIRDIYGKRHSIKMIANMGISMAIGPVTASVIGAYLLYWFNWQAIYIFLIAMAVLAIVGLILIAKAMKLPFITINKASSSHNILTIYKGKLRNPKFLGAIVSLGLVFGCLISFISAAPFIYTHFYQVSLRVFSVIFLVASSSYIVSTIVFRSLSGRIPSAIFIMLGNGMVVVGSLAMALITYEHLYSIWGIILITTIMMGGFGLVVPSAKATAMTIFKQHNGATAALMKAFQMFLSVVITIVASHMYSVHSFLALSVLYVLISSSSLLLFLFLYFSRQSGSLSQHQFIS